MNEEIKNMYAALGIQPDVLAFGENILKNLENRFQEIDTVAEYNQLKVLKAMQDHRVSDIHFAATSGYGYNDMGRDTLEEVYASAFHAEAALVRPQITCGTHALAIALHGNLRPGDELLSISGKPYDTLEEVIGIRPSIGSLAEYGVTYRQVDLLPDGNFDFEGIRAAIGPKTKLVEIQRKMGMRKSVIMDGRDIGTNVFRDAEYKIFLTASAKERAERRFEELTAKGQKVDFDEVLRDIEKRDHDDMTRALNPLRKAEDAVEIDTTGLSIDEVIERVLKEIK